MTSCSFIQKNFSWCQGCAAQYSVATSILSCFSHSFLLGFFSEIECGEISSLIQTLNKIEGHIWLVVLSKGLLKSVSNILSAVHLVF